LTCLACRRPCCGISAGVPRPREAAAHCFGILAPSRSSTGSTTTSPTRTAERSGTRCGVATFDAAVRRFLTEHPAGTVVALGEGLETQFWRVDNGTMRWLTVDLPETLAVRHRLLPDGPRQRSHAGSAIEPGWLDQVDPTGPVLVTAQGLLMYFQREDVHQLIATIAERLPDSSMVVDVVPEAMLRMVSRRPDSEQATRLWTWVFNAGERAGIGAIRGVASVLDLTPPLALAGAPLLLGAVRRLPRRVRYALPVFPVLEVTFRRP